MFLSQEECLMRAIFWLGVFLRSPKPLVTKLFLNTVHTHHELSIWCVLSCFFWLNCRFYCRRDFRPEKRILILVCILEYCSKKLWKSYAGDIYWVDRILCNRRFIQYGKIVVIGNYPEISRFPDYWATVFRVFEFWWNVLSFPGYSVRRSPPDATESYTKKTLYKPTWPDI